MLRNNGYFIALCGGLILSFDTVLIKAIDLPAMQIAFWRSLSMTLPMLLWTLFSTIRSRQIKHLNIKPNKSFALAAVFYGLSSVLFPVSAMTTSIANMLFIIATAPLWAAIFSWFFLSERIHPVTLITFISSIFGILTVLGGVDNLRVDSLRLGDITAIATAMSMAAAFVVGRQSKIDLSLAPSFGSVLATVCIIMVYDVDFNINPSQFALIVLEGSIVVFWALSLIAKASRLISPPHLGFFLLLESVLAPIWIWMIYENVPSKGTIYGGIVILLSIITNSAYFISKSRQKTIPN